MYAVGVNVVIFSMLKNYCAGWICGAVAVGYAMIGYVNDIYKY